MRLPTAVSLCICYMILVSVNINSKLQVVQIIFRHAQRNPAVKFGIDGKPPDLWKPWVGPKRQELTGTGIAEAKALGKLMYNRYGAFLNYSYNASQFFLRSGHVNRTKETAYAFLSELFPITDFNPQNSCRPIRISSDRKIDQVEYSSIRFECPVLAQQLMNSDYYQHLWARVEPQRKILEENLGLNIRDFWAYSSLASALFCMHDLKGPEYFPAWLNPKLWKSIEKSAYWEPFLRSSPDLLRFTAGPLLDEFITRISNYIRGQKLHKFIVYSAHGANLLSVMTALNLPVNRKTPKGADCDYLILEMHLKDRKHFVKFYSRDVNTGLPIRVKMKYCSDPCPLKIFTRLSAQYRMTFDDFHRECSLDTVEKPQEVANPLLATLSAILLLLLQYYRMLKRLVKKKWQIYIYYYLSAK